MDNSEEEELRQVYETFTISELKDELRIRGLSFEGLIEKSELVGVLVAAHVSVSC